MDTNKYFDELDKKIDNMSDDEFEDLLIKSGAKEKQDNEVHEEIQL